MWNDPIGAGEIGEPTSAIAASKQNEQARLSERSKGTPHRFNVPTQIKSDLLLRQIELVLPAVGESQGKAIDHERARAVPHVPLRAAVDRWQPFTGGAGGHH